MDKITIIGTGLIGTSLGMALKKAQVKAEIVGSDRDRGVANRAQKMGGSDSTETNPLRAVKRRSNRGAGHAHKGYRRGDEVHRARAGGWLRGD